MKIRKRFYIAGGSILLIMLITGFGLVAALENSWGFGPKGGFHHGIDHKDIAEFILWRMDKKMKDLNLSEGQQEKYNQLRSNIEKHITSGMDEHETMRDTFHEEMAKEDPNVRLMVDMIKKKINDLSGFMLENLDLVVGFYESLDEEQKTKILSDIRERMESHHH